MNERIQELAKQAGMRHPVMGEVTYARFDYEKFAQLIVRECARIVDSDDSSYPYDSFGHKLKEHFGVEE